MCIKNKAEVFFYLNIAADLSSGGWTFSFWYLEMYEIPSRMIKNSQT